MVPVATRLVTKGLSVSMSQIITGKCTRTRLEHFKNGTGPYSRPFAKNRLTSLSVSRRALKAIDDIELLEPYVGTERACLLAGAFHKVKINAY